ncbi:deoxyribodipyrimidine photo-lyase [Photobacterium swingsii]|uniref:deoxyribodipyrimidine photo-lyase n=1 Tax=Photobacterium swingsii TaxID=680026 RepID=UPI003D11A96C
MSKLVWLRNDLRVVDNTALLQACQYRQASEPVIALYIATPMQWHEHNEAPIKIDFIQRRLVELKQSLAALNIPLIVKEVADFSAVPACILALTKQHQVNHVFCNKQYLVNENQRDLHLGEQLASHSIKLSVFDDDCIIEPGRVLNKQGEPFKVFTPFRKSWVQVYREQIRSTGRALVQPAPSILDDLDELNREASNLESTHSFTYPSFSYPVTTSIDWAVDDEAIRQRLLTFCYEKAMDYHANRDYPAVDGTSCLSPYLAIGALSLRQCFHTLMTEYPECLENPESGAFTWFNELVWREFYRHLMDANPKLCREQPFHAWTNYVVWKNDENQLHAWQQGETGFPIVDAAMRQLKATGWMHNRLRMIVASFLTKDLLIHWQAGEQWFMSHLIDGDMASNNGGWQWAASTGTDAQPYFRVFNPTTQGQRFDPKGEFVRKWVKELKDVPDKFIHSPHLWLGAHTLSYPQPIVDHKQARLLAIETFKRANEQGKLQGSV